MRSTKNFIFFLHGCHKKLGVNYEQSLEMGPCSIIGIMGHFTTGFTSKLHDNVVFQFAMSECRCN